MLVVAILGSVLFGLGNSQGTDVAEVNLTSAVLAPEAHWERFIAPAPTIVSLLGGLMVISTKTDFSLERSKPTNGWEYISNPKSFRATLVQISNEGWSAFNDAHTNMDKIQLYMVQVPRRVKSALRIIDRGNLKLIKRLLPKPLQHIGSMANKSAELAIETHESFSKMMLLLGEVIKVTTSEQGQTSQELRAIELELNTTKATIKSMKELGTILKKRVDKLDSDVERFREDYEQAMDDIPTGWDAIGLSLGHAFVGIVKDVGNSFFLGGGDSGSGGSAAGGSDPETTEQQIEGNFGRSFIRGTLISFAGQLDFMFKTLKGVFESGKVTSADDPKKAFTSIKKALNGFKQQILEYNSPSTKAYQQKAIERLDSGLDLCDLVVKAFDDASKFPNKTTSDNIQSILKDLLNSVNEMSVSGGPKGQGTTNGQGSNSVQNAGDPDDIFYNEKFAATTALDAYKHAQARSDKMFKEYLLFQEKSAKLMAKIAELNFEKVDFKKILELMREGVDILTEIRRQWSKLVLFFSSIAVRAEVTLKTTVEPFLDYTKELQEMDSLTDDDKMIYLDLLIEEAKEIQEIAYFLHMVTKTYVHISEKYIITQLAGLPALLAADSNAKRTQMVLKLQRDAKAATKYIEDMARGQRETYEATVQKKIDEMTENLENYESYDDYDE